MKPWNLLTRRISCSKKNLYIKQIDRSSRILLFVSPIRPAVGVLPLFIVSNQTSHGQAMVKKTSIHTNRLESNSVELIKLCTIFSLNKDLKLLKFPNKGVTKGSEIKTDSEIQTTKIRPVSSSVSIVQVSKDVARKYKTKYKSGVAWKTQG